MPTIHGPVGQLATGDIHHHHHWPPGSPAACAHAPGPCRHCTRRCAGCPLAARPVPGSVSPIVAGTPPVLLAWHAALLLTAAWTASILRLAAPALRR